MLAVTYILCHICFKEYAEKRKLQNYCKKIALASVRPLIMAPTRVWMGEPLGPGHGPEGGPRSALRNLFF